MNGGERELPNEEGADSGVERGEAGSLVGRWSARKRRATNATDAANAVAATRAADATTREPEAGRRETEVDLDAVQAVNRSVEDAPLPDGNVPRPSDEPVLYDADMPPLESLGATSDMSPFFSRGVTAALRRAALRKIFSLPRYNVRDGLNDYDGDYTVFEPLGTTVTADMKFHAARHERDRLARESEAVAERSDRVVQDDDGEAPESTAEQEFETAETAETAESSDSDDADVLIGAEAGTGTARSATAVDDDDPGDDPGELATRDSFGQKS